MNSMHNQPLISRNETQVSVAMTAWIYTVHARSLPGCLLK